MFTVHGVNPDYTREGGSIPVVLTLSETTGKDCVLLPMGRSDDGAHSQNEKLNISNFQNGVRNSRTVEKPRWRFFLLCKYFRLYITMVFSVRVYYILYIMYVYIVIYIYMYIYKQRFCQMNQCWLYYCIFRWNFLQLTWKNWQL